MIGNERMLIDTVVNMNQHELACWLIWNNLAKYYGIVDLVVT